MHSHPSSGSSVVVVVVELVVFWYCVRRSAWLKIPILIISLLLVLAAFAFYCFARRAFSVLARTRASGEWSCNIEMCVINVRVHVCITSVHVHKF